MQLLLSLSFVIALPVSSKSRQLFFIFRKVWGYPTLLIPWFINFKCNMDGVIFVEEMAVAFDPEPFENEDLIRIPSICLTSRGIQNYITVSVLSRRSHDIILPPNTLGGLVNHVQSVTPIEKVHIIEKEKETLIAKNRHKMAARHHIKDESIIREKKNANEKHEDKIL